MRWTTSPNAFASLGYPAPGTNTQFAKLTSIDETDGVPEAMEMVRLLTKGHEAVARTAREVLPAADKGGDESTTDLLTQRLQSPREDRVDVAQHVEVGSSTVGGADRA